ncbi:MAG: type II secretion system protein, partial [Candidatus Omnitrophica bacterium]|nr:type II secretion system protein [Candidatus Omnitrophota bacterium]
MKKSRKGFTLIEIMMVLAVIMILAGVAIPSMIRSRVTSNEATTIVNLKGLYTTFIMYYNDNDKEYPLALADMSQYISASLAQGSKSGYLYVYQRIDEDTFIVNANPERLGKTGSRYFFLDESGIIRYNSSGEASVTDP